MLNIDEKIKLEVFKELENFKKVFKVKPDIQNFIRNYKKVMIKNLELEKKLENSSRIAGNILFKRLM